jgi:hypothetical protein
MEPLATPYGRSYGVHTQGPTEAVPGGYRAVLILEKLRGDTLGDLWVTLAREDRLRALKAFDLAKAYVGSLLSLPFIYAVLVGS